MTPTKRQERVFGEGASIGIGLLIAESESGAYQPVAAVSTISEAREIASHDIRSRTRGLAQGNDPFCPARYLVWAQGDRGAYIVAATIEV